MAELSKQTVYKKLFNDLKNKWGWIALSTIFAVFSVVGGLLVPYCFGQIIDVIVYVGNVNFEVIALYTIVIIISLVIAALSQWLMNLINNKITYELTKEVRKKAFEHLQNLPLNYIDTHAYGDTVSRMIADVEQYADGLLMGFTQFFTGVLTILGTLVLMALLNWIIAIVVVIITPLSLFVAKFISSKTYHMSKKTTEIRGEQTAFIDEMIENLKVVKAFSREDENQVVFDEINERLEKSSLSSIFFSSLTNPCTRFVNSIVYAVVAFVGAMSLIYPAMLPVAFSVGNFSTLLSYANQYTKPFNEITGVITELQNAIACVGRVYELLDEPVQVSDEGNIQLQKVAGDVTFDDVSFSYVPERPLIENFNLKVKAGQNVAIVGPTGCGKTTLINLIMRFYDTVSGDIEVDGNKIKGVTRKSLRQNIGMVLQETWLKSGTIRQNITMGKPDATEEEIIAAAKAAHSYDFIMQMQNGFNTVIAEDGGSLSQGQKQLLCITRIMLCLPPMLILDEATSSIDTRTELKISQTFQQMMKGRTSFIVAHRLSTIQNADLILVMNNGHIVEQGTHAELLAQGGFYKNLYNSQFAK